MKKANIILRSLTLGISVILVLLAACPVNVYAQKQLDSYEARRALELWEEEDYEGALKYIDQEVANHPKSAKAHLTKAYLHYQQYEWGQALSSVNKGMQLLPKKEKSVLASAYLLRGGIHEMLNDSAEYMADYKEAYRLDPTDSDVSHTMVQAYINNHQDDLAEEVLKEMIKHNSADLYPYMQLMVMSGERGDVEQARYYMNQVRRCGVDEPAEQFLQFLMSEYEHDYPALIEHIVNQYEPTAFRVEGEMDKALTAVLDTMPDETLHAFYKKELSNPENAEYWQLARAYLNQRLSRHADALKIYRDVDRETSTELSGAFYAWIGMACFELGLFDYAVRYLKKSQDLGGDSQSTYVLLPEAYMNNEQFEESVEATRQLMKEFPDSPETWYDFMADAYDMWGKYDEALDNCNKVLVLTPEDVGVHLKKANLLKDRFNRVDEAVEEYRKVIDIEQSSGKLERSMFAYVGIGEPEKGKAIVDSLLSADPTSDNYYDAACMASRMNQPEQALDYLETSLKMGYVYFTWIRHDADMEPLHKYPRFSEMLDRYQQQYMEKMKAVLGEDKVMDMESNGEEKVGDVYEIPITHSPNSGTYELKAAINSVPMTFIFDTGCDDVSISDVESKFLQKNGHLLPSDFRGMERFVDAQGNVSVSQVVILREIKIGDLVLNNVKASVIPNQKAPLLLGQTVLQRFGKVEIDNQRKVLKIYK